jgi:ABC-2 type transport system permease protein
VLALLRVALQNALQYRASFLLSFVVGSLTTGAIVASLLFVYNHTQSVAGWTLPEALLVTAFFTLLSGILGGIVEPNLGAIVEGVRSGQLDYLILRPVDVQLAATVNRVDPTKVWDVLGAVAIGAYALSAIEPPTWIQALTAAVLLVSGLAAMYALWILVVCLSFWFVRVDNLRYLVGAVTDAGRWPVTVYKGFARTFLTVFVPVALVTSWPAMALLGRMDGWLALQSVVVAMVLLAVSRFAWLQALRHYTSASS